MEGLIGWEHEILRKMNTGWVKVKQSSSSRRLRLQDYKTVGT